MTAHELAKQLLGMKDLPVEVVTHVDGPYVATKTIESKHNVWELMGYIRIQPSGDADAMAKEGVM